MRIVVKGRCRDAETKEEWDETITVEMADGQTFEEAYRGVLNNFNATLRPGEHRRDFVSAELIGSSDQHRWEKTNLVTVVKKSGQSYDTMRCSKCGSTGKRYGLGPGTTIDRAFKKHEKQCPVLG